MNKIGFIGTGNIASAIISGISKGVYITNDDIFLYDVDKTKLKALSVKGYSICETLKKLTENVKYIFITVKPQIYAAVLNELSNYITEDKVIVTVAPGFTTKKVKELIKTNVPVIRTMPNTPLLLGQGATAIAKSDALQKDFEFVKGVFSCAGEVEILEENLMDEVIAVSGSSPAYIFFFAKAMVDYAKSVGIDEETAFNLTVATIKGSAKMLSDSEMTADQLIKMVKSPNGTTEAALNVLEKEGFYDSIIRGMDACTKRAKELGEM